MKYANVCGFKLWVPDNVADWDAVASTDTHRSPWEMERLDSIIEHMGEDKVLYDIGAEHGWMSAIFALYGRCKLVLVEPTDAFWPNIAGCWQYNSLPAPVATVHAFCADEVRPGDNGGPHMYMQNWPPQAKGPESMARDYAHLNHVKLFENPGTTTIDYIAKAVPHPDGITVDVEGAELLVMKGAMLTLHEARPLVWISVHPDLMERDFGSTPEELFTYMDQAGYDATHLRTDHEQHFLFEPR